MICPLCGSDNWDVYAKRDAHHTGGLSVVCAGLRATGASNGIDADVCLWAIHLTREQMIEAAFLITQHERTAAKEAA